MTPELQAAIDAFRPIAVAAKYNTQRGAYQQCTEASNDFLLVLEEHGVTNATIEHFEVGIPEDAADYPPGHFNMGWHWAVRVGSLVIDWTARQFQPRAAFPLIWECPVRVWRNCEHPEYASWEAKERLRKEGVL